jgi:hypothetical protein
MHRQTPTQQVQLNRLCTALDVAIKAMLLPWDRPPSSLLARASSQQDTQLMLLTALLMRALCVLLLQLAAVSPAHGVMQGRSGCQCQQR